MLSAGSERGLSLSQFRLNEGMNERAECWFGGKTATYDYYICCFYMIRMPAKEGRKEGRTRLLKSMKYCRL